MDDYNRGSHSVYKLTYHIIFVTKYRKKVITDEIGDFMKDMAEYLCNRMDCTLISAETDEDHIHMLVSMPPDIAPVKLVPGETCKHGKDTALQGSTCHLYRTCGKISVEGFILERKLFLCYYRVRIHGDSQVLY